MPEQCSPWARSCSPQTYVMLRFLDPGHLCHSSPRAFMESKLVMLARQIPVRSWTSSDLNTLSVKVSKGIVLWTPSIKLKPACLTLNGMQESFVNLLWLVVEACLVEQFWSFLMLPSKDTASNLDPSNKVVISYYSVSSVLCTQKHRGVGKLQNPLSYKSTSVTFAAKAVLMCRGFSRSSGELGRGPCLHAGSYWWARALLGSVLMHCRVEQYHFRVRWIPKAQSLAPG